jgi:hypothetical protein
MNVPVDQLANARKALRLAGGEWAEVRQHQAHTQANPDDGWLTYLCKHHLMFRPSYQALREGGASWALPTFTGAWYAAPNTVRRQATKIYSTLARTDAA